MKAGDEWINLDNVSPQMKDTKKFLAFDLGANSGRAVVGSLNKDKLQIEELLRFLNQPITIHNTIYWDVLYIFNQIKKALRKYSQKYGKNLNGIGVDTWGVDFGFIDQNGKLVNNPVHYRDPRTDGMMEETFKRIPKEEIFEETGIQFIQLNTLYQLLAMKLANSPSLQLADNLLMMAGLFNYFLTGRRVAEFTLATTTQVYNPRTGSWSKKIFDHLGLPYRIMPEVIQPGTKIGWLLPSIQDEVGLKKVPVIAPACHDTASAVAAIPAGDKQWVFLSSGTWSLLGAEVGKPIINHQALKYNFTNEGGVGGTYRFLRNITGLWLLQELKREWEKSGEKFPYSELTQMAKEEEGSVSFVDSDDELFLTPGNMEDKIRKFCQRTEQPAPADKASFVRCILESLALKYRYVLDRLESLLNKKLEVLHVVGGGVRNELLCQFTANATNKVVIGGPAEATAIGNILVQAMVEGELSSIDKARQLVGNSCDLKTYQPANVNKWEEAYQQFIDIINEKTGEEI